MTRFALAAAVGAACLGLTACGDYDKDEYNNAAEYNADSAGYNEAGRDYGNTAAGNAAASGYSFPTGARIVEEGNVTYRVDADGTRVRLGPNDSRIVVEDGIRYRVDPGGARVRIGDDGAVISVPVDDDVNVEVNTVP